jgi:hypothetical protein
MLVSGQAAARGRRDDPAHRARCDAKEGDGGREGNSRGKGESS